MRLLESENVFYTFVRKSDGHTFTADTFLAGYNNVKKASEPAAADFVAKFNVFKNGDPVSADDFFKSYKMTPPAPAKKVEEPVETSTEDASTETVPKSTKTSDEDKKVITPAGTTIKTDETPVETTPKSDDKSTPSSSNAPTTNPVAKITDATVDQLVKLIDDIGVTVYDKNTHKKVALNKIDGRSLNDYVILLGGKNPVSVRAWIKRLRERGVLTESILEEFTADEMTKSGKVYLYMNIISDSSDAEFTLDIDEIGQIVITPEDEAVSFDGVSVLSPNGEGAFVSVDNDESVVEPTVVIDYTMTSTDNDYSYFATIDDIGQIIITPENDNTSFVSATVGDNLNISAEDENIKLMESIESVLARVRKETENYTTLNGEIYANNEEDADTIKTALEMYYDNVQMSEELGKYTISYSDDAPMTEELLTEDDGEDLPLWKVSFKFSDNIENDGEIVYTEVNAENSEDANKFGEQYARKMALEDESWKKAHIVSLQLLK